jgi:endonuclease/exonuclease/phosphatase family metal-dependent hydrolase
MAKKTENKTRKNSLAGKIVLAVNFLAVIFLLLSYLSPFISPEHFTILAFFGLAYPVTVAINILFMVAWMILGKWRLFFSLFAILLGFNHILSLFQLNSEEPVTPGNKSIKILTYNVRVFDHFNKKSNITTRNKIFSFLKSTDANIYCFQEFYDNKNGEFPVLDTLSRLLNVDRYVSEYFDKDVNQHYTGLVTMSKLPILGGGNIRVDSNSPNFAIYSDILSGNDTIRVYNLHLESIRLSKEDYLFYDEIGKQTDKAELKEGSAKILIKLYRAFKIRAKQSNLLKEHISQSPYPVFVCGDMNDTPNSYAYHQISSGLKDSFMEAGRGLGNTYNGIFPSFRIDYILHSSEYQCISYKKGKIKTSDHFPVTAVYTR